MNATTLRALRKSAGYTQARAAACLGIPLATYRNYDQGHRSVPDDIATRALAFPVRQVACPHCHKLMVLP